MKIITTLFLSLILLGCTGNSSLFYKDGREAKIINCEGSSWLGCLKQASLLCQQSGYEILEKISYKDQGFFATTDKKEMIIICKESSKAPISIPNNPITESNKIIQTLPSKIIEPRPVEPIEAK